MPVALAGITLGFGLVVLAASSNGGVPKLDMNPTCRSPARLDLGGTADVNVCLASEQRVRDQLVKEWSTFPAQDRRECIELVTHGGPPSYIELYTCLEMAREVRRLRRENATKKRA